MTTSARDREMARMVARYVPSQQGPAGRTEMSPYDLVLYHCAAALAAARAEERDACLSIAARVRDKWLSDDVVSNPDRRAAERAQHKAYAAAEIADAIYARGTP